jgi:pSer/pThr/pTyr-binding forkhead associated (FHA) protein
MLVVTEGALTGATRPLGSAPVTIGRAHDSTLVLTDDFASSHHARLVPRDGQWLIEDLGSTNGTYLDRTKVISPMPVPLGASVRIGKTVLELRR